MGGMRTFELYSLATGAKERVNQSERNERESECKKDRGSRGRVREKGLEREAERKRENVEWFTCIASIAPTQGQRVCENERTRPGRDLLPSSAFQFPVRYSLSLFLANLILSFLHLSGERLFHTQAS